MKTTNSKGTREAGHQSQATQRRKVISSERERKPKKHEKGFKNKSLKIDRQQILEYPKICCQLMQNLKATKKL